MSLRELYAQPGAIPNIGPTALSFTSGPGAFSPVFQAEQWSFDSFQGLKLAFRGHSALNLASLDLLRPPKRRKFLGFP